MSIVQLCGSCTFVAAVVPMPEAAVDEEGGFVFGQDDVGADKRSTKYEGRIMKEGGRDWDFDVEAEAEAHFVEGGADAQFW